jgi:copper(I)-binding protein
VDPRHRAVGQVGGLFMQLVRARRRNWSRCAWRRRPAELHQMAMEGQTMRMRAVDAIELPAGQAVNLASGGYHVMLFDLKRQLKEGETVPVTRDTQQGQRCHRHSGSDGDGEAADVQPEIKRGSQ